jgi:superfamily II DNA or RNA helicase/ribosomal protein S27E
MSWKCEQVRETRLRPARDEEEYALHTAALEWRLAEAIVIQTAADIQSTPKWADRVKPFEHQVQNLFTFCRRLPVTMLADDVGLGKTISAGLILSELMTRRRVRRTLVLCPKILCPQWVEELDSKFGITSKVATGKDLSAELKRQTPVVITTYHSARNFLPQIRPDSFDFLVLDEAHKLRNLHGTQKPPEIALRVRNVLEQRLFKYVVMLTATPMQNRLWDLYSLIDLLTVAKGHKNPLGTSDEFVMNFLGNDDRKLQRGAVDRFRGILRNYLVRTRRGDSRLKFPTREVRVIRVEAPAIERGLTGIVAANIARLNGLVQTSVAQAMMSSPQALASQLENMARNGNIDEAAAVEARALAQRIREPAKLERLLFLINELRTSRPGDWRVVVFTIRKETQQVICEALERRGIALGLIQGAQARQNQASIERFRANPPQAHVLVSTDAGAEGINLQVANVLVNYDLPWNPMIVEQRIGRVQRLASQHEHVIICNLVVSGSVEERIVGRLMEKLQSISHAVGDIESILESGGWDADQEQNGFEGQIRDLVVKSLLGQDMAVATQRAEDSIARAEQAIEQQRHEIDQTLGVLDSLHESGPRMPKLGRVDPSVSSEEFVLRAKTAGGGQVQRRNDETFEVRVSGLVEEVITFNEDVAASLAGQASFMSNVRLYLPGKPAFERLVQHWVDHSGHFHWDKSALTRTWAETLAGEWCQTIPGGEFKGVDLSARQPKFQGKVRVKVKASNGVDSYEKLITQDFQPEGHESLPPESTGGDLVATEVLPSEVIPDILRNLSQTIAADDDIDKFVRFYIARQLEEELQAGDDPRKLHKIKSDFDPLVSAEIVALQGAEYEEATLGVRFTIDGKGGYQAQLRAIPATRQILEQPSRADCDVSKSTVPESCLAACALSGRRVLRHLLVTSDASGRQALPEYTVSCEITGQTAFVDEMALSAVSGKSVVASLLRKSPVSGRLGLLEEFAECQVTGKRVLTDELSRSDVTGSLFVSAEGMRSAVSGILGHRTEFVKCDKTRESILPSEADKSAVSGKVVRRDLLRASEKPPGRLGVEDEFAVCAITEKRLLNDELDQSAVSGKLIDRDLLHRSSRSGSLALEEELVTCEESGARLLPAETASCQLTGKRVDLRLLSKSDVSGARALTHLLIRCPSTGKLALPSEFQKCEITGDSALPELLGVCAITGKRSLLTLLAVCAVSGDNVLSSETGKSAISAKIVRKDLLKPSDKPPGRLGMDAEFVVCEATGIRLLIDEIALSAASGKRVDRDLLRPSARSSRLALADELYVCDVSGASLLPDETEFCTITGKRVDARLVGHSELSGLSALSDLLVRCAETNTLVLPTELEECDLTHRRVLPKLLGTCAVSGARVLLPILIKCAHTGDGIVPTASGESAVSGKVVRKDILRPSDKLPGRLGLEAEFGICEVTGQQLLIDELARSAVSGKLVDRDLLRDSDRSGQLALSDELIVCDVSGKNLLPNETEACAITGKRVDSRLVGFSQVSARPGLLELMARCAESQTLALPSELEECDLSHRRVLPTELGTCAVTGARALISKLIKCEQTGDVIIASAAGKSAYSGKTVRHDLLHPSEKPPHRLGLKGEIGTCAATGKHILWDELGESAVSGNWVDTDLLRASANSGLLALPSELVTCELSGELFLPAETAVCQFTKKHVDRRLLVRSEVSGVLALADSMKQCVMTNTRGLPAELEQCAVSGQWALPDQLRPCAVTAQRALPHAMLKSDVSGKLAIPGRAVRSAVSNKICLRIADEAVKCAWLQKLILRLESATCRLTGLKVAKSHLNDDNELKVLRDLLDSESGFTADEKLLRALQSAKGGALRRLKEARFKRGPNGGVLAISGALRGLLGLDVRYVGFLFRTGETPDILGHYSIGHWSAEGGWIVEERH